MKKSLLLTAALTAALMAQAATHNVYVANCTQWGTDVAIYSWGDSEIFGGWPGATPDATVTLNGVEYNQFIINGHDGETAHMIFNNNNNGQQVDLPEVTLNAADYYFATNGVEVKQFASPAEADVTFEAVSTFVYAIDNTGWSDLYVYAWADGQAEVFGGWPGAKFAETAVVNGVTYKKVPFPGNGTITYNLIFNDGNGTQFDGPSVVSGKDLFVELTADSFTIIEGSVDNPVVTTPDALYLIGNLADNNWNPSAGVAFTRNGDEFTAEGVTFVAVDDNEVAYFSLTSVLGANANDWAPLKGHRYGADPDNALLTPGITADMLAAADEPAAWQINPGKYDITVDFAEMTITVSSNFSGVESIAIDSDSSAAEYFNLQGIRVARPAFGGVYILKQGNKVSKVIL